MFFNKDWRTYPTLQNAAAYGLGAQDPLLALTGRTSRVPGDVTAQFGSAGFALDSSPAHQSNSRMPDSLLVRTTREKWMQG